MRWLLYILGFWCLLTFIYQIVTHSSDNISINADVCYPNSFLTEKFGDSIQVDYVKNGDTIVRHYTDLKYGLSDDEFDNSFDVHSWYTIKLNNKLLQGPYHSFTVNDYQFSYNRAALLRLCDSMIISDETQSYYFQRLKNEVEQKPESSYYARPILYRSIIRSGVFSLAGGDVIPFFSPGYAVDLFKHLPCKVTHTKTKMQPWAIVVEDYYSNFSGGQNGYLVYDYLHITPLAKNLHYIK